MANAGRIYRRTAAGTKAWDTQNSQVPLDYRRVLGLITVEMHGDELRTRLGRYTEAALLEMLADLELRGLVESREDQPESDLDFTGSFNVVDLFAAQQKK